MQYHPKEEVIKILKDKLVKSDSYKDKETIVEILGLIKDKNNLEFFSFLIKNLNIDNFIDKTINYNTQLYREYSYFIGLIKEFARLEDAEAEMFILEYIMKFKNYVRLYSLLSYWYKYDIESMEFLNELLDILEKSKEEKGSELYFHLLKKYAPKDEATEKKLRELLNNNLYYFKKLEIKKALIAIDTKNNQEIDLEDFHKYLSNFEDIKFLRNSKHSRDRKKAIRIIKKQPRDLSYPLLLQIYKEEKDTSVKQVAFNALVNISPEDKIQLIKTTIIQDTDTKIRGFCCLKLERIQGEESTEFIINALKEEKNLWVKKLQIRILGRINTVKSIAALKELLESNPKRNIMREIIYVFGLSRRLELTKLLLNIVFEDKQRFIVTAAIMAIIRIGDESSIKILRDKRSEIEDGEIKHYIQSKLREYDETYKQGYKFGINR